jgi:hypothetical protein
MHPKGCSYCAQVALGTGELFDVPTRTEVRPSSSEALLPPPALLLTLIRELLRGAGLTMALIGRGGWFPGDVGGLTIVGGKGGGPARYKTLKTLRVANRRFQWLAGWPQLPPKGVPRPCETQRRGAG